MFLFIRGSIKSARVLNVSISTSQKTTLIPRTAAASAVAIYVQDGHIISSPGFRFNAMNAICKASVPLAHVITFLTFKNAERFVANSLTIGPLTNLPDSIKEIIL